MIAVLMAMSLLVGLIGATVAADEAAADPTPRRSRGVRSTFPAGALAQAGGLGTGSLPIGLSRLLGGAAPGHSDAGFDRAEAGFAGSDGLGQGRPQRPVAFR